MRQWSFFAAVVFLTSTFVSASCLAQTLAPTPPMGWNSWDAYGLTINETQFRANATVLAGLRQYGWQYAVIDEGWYMADPAGQTVPERKYLWDAHGLLMPAPDRFPSAANGAGFKPLADWVHAQGLKFGIHIVRGIPRQVVDGDMPIAGTNFTAREAADLTSPCPWDQGNWGVKDNAAGQAYYDSMMKLYADWGIDFIKVDCISDHPYRPTEIRQIAEAIRKTGRPIVLSLSPGPTAPEHAAEVAKYAQMWRITNDHWDVWAPAHKPGAGEFPFGLKAEFDRIAEWNSHAGPGHWPDPDMLPWGWLGPSPGLGRPRQSRETHDEQQTEFTLWCMARAPLIAGANLTRLDDFTRSLMTNREVIALDQESRKSYPLEHLPPGFDNARVWVSEREVNHHRRLYLAFFNLDDAPATLHATWQQLGLHGAKYAARNVWTGERLKKSSGISMTLPAHGSTIYSIED
jgi:alpha-galactosidase